MTAGTGAAPRRHDFKGETRAIAAATSVDRRLQRSPCQYRKIRPRRGQRRDVRLPRKSARDGEPLRRSIVGSPADAGRATPNGWPRSTWTAPHGERPQAAQLGADKGCDAAAFVMELRGTCARTSPGTATAGARRSTGAPPGIPAMP